MYKYSIKWLYSLKDKPLALFYEHILEYSTEHSSHWGNSSDTKQSQCCGHIVLAPNDDFPSGTKRCYKYCINLFKTLLKYPPFIYSIYIYIYITKVESGFSLINVNKMFSNVSSSKEWSIFLLFIWFDVMVGSVWLWQSKLTLKVSFFYYYFWFIPVWQGLRGPHTGMEIYASITLWIAHSDRCSQQRDSNSLKIPSLTTRKKKN